MPLMVKMECVFMTLQEYKNNEKLKKQEKKEKEEKRKKEIAENRKLATRSKHFTFILYTDENLEHKEIHDYLNSQNPENIATIRIYHHGEIYETENGIPYTWENLENGKIDKCTFFKKYAECGFRCNDKGLIEKNHYHYILRFPNARTYKSTLRSFGLNQALCSPINDLKQYFLYCMHMTYESRYKHRYDFSDWELLGGQSLDLYNSACSQQNDGVTNFQHIVDIMQNDYVENARELLYNLVANGNINAVEFIRKNPYFVKTYLIPENQVNKIDVKQAVLQELQNLFPVEI